MSIIETIKERISCRTYGDRPIEPDKTETLKTFLKENTSSPFGSEIRFQLLDFTELGMSETRMRGTYGVIKGTRQFMAGAVRNRPKAMEDYGYCMEKNILKATSLGLGTCWLGGTFNRTPAGRESGRLFQRPEIAGRHVFSLQRRIRQKKIMARTIFRRQYR
jgi:hypothetical protein